MKLTPIILLLITSLNIWAGNSVGNGGDILLCPDTAGQLLDLYEAKELHKMNLIESSDNYQAILKQRLALLKGRAPGLASLYEKKLAQYRISFKSDIELRNIKDEKFTYIPKNCVLSQIAYKTNLPSSQFDIVINHEHWSKLSEVNKAALLLHEVAYDHMKFFGVKNSTGARKLVGLLFSEKMAQVSKTDIKKLFLELKIPLDE